MMLLHPQDGGGDHHRDRESDHGESLESLRLHLLFRIEDFCLQEYTSGTEDGYQREVFREVFRHSGFLIVHHVVRVPFRFSDISETLS